jgi:hypothetical protein
VIKRRILAVFLALTLTTALTGVRCNINGNPDCEVFCDDD